MLKEYYESLIIDIGADMTTLETSINNLSNSSNSYARMIEFVRDDAPADSLMDPLEIILGTEQFSASLSTYESLISSGNINLISEVDLKKELYRVYGLYDDVEFLDEVNYNYYFNTILPL